MARTLPAQGAAPGPFVPLGSRLDRVVVWAIDEGALPGIDPLTRPFRLAAVRRATAAADTMTAHAGQRRALRWIAGELRGLADTTSLVAEAAVAAYRNPRRDSFRPTEPAHRNVTPAGGLRATVVRGNLVVVVNPAFENRLLDDPEYTGYTKRFVAGRMQEAYVALTGPRGDLVFGRMPRNWGPAPFEGLLVSPNAYAVDALVGALRAGRFELTAIAQRLDDRTDTTVSRDVRLARYFFAHRLNVNLGRGAWLGLTEAGVYGGPGRSFEPAFHVPVNVALLSQDNENLSVNILLGADLAVQVRHSLRVAFSGFLDDIQVDRDSLTDRRPTSYGLSAMARLALPSRPVHVALGYTAVSYVAYRNSFNRNFEYSNRGVGLGRNFSGYDQALLQVEVLAGPRASVALDLSYLRQGSGDFRDPFPSDSVLAQPGHTLLVAPVRRSPGARLTLDIEPWRGVGLRGELGAVRRLSGGTEAIFGLSVHVRADVLHRRLGGVLPALDPGASRGWP